MSRFGRVLRFLGKRPATAPICGHQNAQVKKLPTIEEWRAAGSHSPVLEWTGRERGWMGTSTGRKFYPLDPRPEDVDIRDVARGLAMTCRYGGQVKRFYSVAEHCVHVSLHVPIAYCREALVHDSAEAYIGDMIRPLKHQPEMSEFRRCEDVIERCIYQALGIVSTPESHAAIKEIDNRILVDEITQLSACPDFYLNTPMLRDVKPLGVKLLCYAPADAESFFRSTYYNFFGVLP